MIALSTDWFGIRSFWFSDVKPWSPCGNLDAPISVLILERVWGCGGKQEISADIALGILLSSELLPRNVE